METSLDDILGWDTATWSNALTFWRAYGPPLGPGARCLEVGSGGGGISLWLARQGCDVVCSDITVPGPEARALHRRQGVSSRVSYRACDVMDLGFREEFDVVVFRSVLGALGDRGGREPQRTALQEIGRALRPGGALLFAENLAASGLHRWARRRFVPWGREWAYIPLAELGSLLDPFPRWSVETTGVVAAFGRTERQRRRLAAVDRRLTRLVPDRWHYLAYGVARTNE